MLTVFLAGGVEITPFVVCDADGKPGDNPSLISLLASLLGQKDAVNVRKNTASSNGHTAQQLAQLFIIAHSQLNVAGHNTGLLIVTCGIASQLQHLSRKVLQYCCLQDDKLLVGRQSITGC